MKGTGLHRVSWKWVLAGEDTEEITLVWLVHSQLEPEKAANLERKHLFPFRQSPPRYNSSHCTTLESTDCPTSTTFKSKFVLSRLSSPAFQPAQITTGMGSPASVAASFPHPHAAKHPNLRAGPTSPSGHCCLPCACSDSGLQDVCVVKANQVVHLPSKRHHQVKNRWRMLATEGCLFSFPFFFPLMIQKASNSILALDLDQHILLSHGWCLHSNLNTCGWAC